VPEPVNLFSDTQTRPTEAMRRAMAAAEVGDEQLGLDPTVNALQERVAELLGHEAALFLPTGTMCNVIGVALHVRPGEEVLLGRDAHPIHHEAAGAAAIAGAVHTVLDGEGGMFTGEQVRAAVSPAANRYAPATRLVSVEQTTNLGGGRVWPAEQLAGVLEAVREHGLRAHLDGARLMNAAVAAGVAPSEMAGGFDTAWVDFTKGLGAPVGACLAGSAELITEAWRWKQRLGGAMRQAGIIAAGALHALDHHVDRLAEDHARARRLAEGLAELPGVSVDPARVETNIVVFEVPDAGRFAGGLWERDVRVSPLGPTRLRAVTHLDVDDAAIERALTAAAEVAGSS
jgi:threonine aldolase